MPAIPAEKTKLQIEGGTPGTFTDLAQVLRVGAVKKKVEPVKTTFLDSSQQTYRPGQIPDHDPMTFRIAYDPNNVAHQQMFTDLDAGKTNNFQIVYNDGLTTPAKCAFAGFYTSIDEDDKEDQANVEADVNIQITGPAVRTPGTP